MKKIPTLFVRKFENHKVVEVTPEVTPSMEWVLAGDGIATVKVDGACCMVKGGELYKRYDAKRGKTPPAGAVPCCPPDPVTGHWPHWVKINLEAPSSEDKWFASAYNRTRMSIGDDLFDGTYEAVGLHFNSNPYNMEADILIRHGAEIIDLKDRTFDGIKSWLRDHTVEGIVFWLEGEPMCKIKRRDFGFEWPIKK